MGMGGMFSALRYDSRNSVGERMGFKGSKEFHGSNIIRLRWF